MVEPVAVAKPLTPSVELLTVGTPAEATLVDHLHELRVRIPVDLHRQLLSLKVLRGKSLAETVSTALDVYFAEHAKRVADASSSQR